MDQERALSGVMQTRKREFWNNAEPERLPDAWRMTKVKGDHVLTALCGVWAVEMGWELRLMIDNHGLQMSSLCRPCREMMERCRRVASRDDREGLELTDEKRSEPSTLRTREASCGDSCTGYSSRKRYASGCAVPSSTSLWCRQRHFRIDSGMPSMVLWRT